MGFPIVITLNFGRELRFSSPRRMTSPQKPAELFVTLWSLHSREIYGYIYSLVFNASDADDIYQETSLVLLQKIDEFQPGTNFAVWACRVAYHKVLQSRDRRGVPKFIDDSLLEILDREALSRSTDELDTRMAALTECLAKLSMKDRKLIRQRYQRGCTVESLAKQMGRSGSLVYKSITRIQRALLECIRRRLTEGERR
jgi:RNA polymerase sigma-70 factor (ECF subfamily)